MRSELVSRPGWSSEGAATLNISRRTRLGGLLDYQDEAVAHYELRLTDDGEVMLLKSTDKDTEAVYSELINEE